MNYYTLLGFSKEPFSTSPDPDFFYQSQGHHEALTRLMIEIRLKRGMSLILGDVGTGKTTLSRKLFQMIMTRRDIVFHMILDPVESSEQAFLVSLLRALNISMPHATFTPLDCKEAIKKYLFQKGVQEKKTVVLLIDEAQKLNPVSLEVLRTLLNYETTEFKLLQLVLLGQLELLPLVSGMKNFWDRISYKQVLRPLDVQATRELIDFRVAQAGYKLPGLLFTEEAVAEICRYTQGCPRRIGMLCHNALKAVLMQDKRMVDETVIQSLIHEEALVGV